MLVKSEPESVEVVVPGGLACVGGVDAREDDHGHGGDAFAEIATWCSYPDVLDAASLREAAEGVVKEFGRKLGRVAELYAAPQQPHEVRGPKLLREHFERWVALN